MEGRTTGRRGVAILAIAILAAGALAASSAGAAAPLTKKKVKKIATKVANQVFDQKAGSLKDKCPGGTVSVAGGCLESATRGQASWFDAKKNCSGVGRRLPTAGELIAGFATPGVTAATETSSNLHLDDNGTTIAQRYIVVTSGGSIGGQANLSTVGNYRCIAPMTNL
jgi:hypothetical protein